MKSMDSSLLDIMYLLGAMALVLFGSKHMAEGLQKALGERLRTGLYQFRHGWKSGLIGGGLLNVGLQSTASTMVMLLGLVSSGLFTLLEAMPLMIGTKLGASLSAWLLVFLEFEWNLSQFSVPVLAFCFPLLFYGGERVRNLGEFTVGIAIIFVGFYFMHDVIPDLRQYPNYVAFMDQYVNLGPGAVLMFATAGALFGMLTQSTLVVMGFTMILLTTGWIDFGVATALVLGENLGASIITQLSALGTNVYGRRMAFAQSFMALATLSLALLLFNPLLNWSEWMLGQAVGIPDLQLVEGSRDELYLWGAHGLALAHTSFNLIVGTLLLLVPGRIARLSQAIVRSTHKWDRRDRLQYLHTNLLHTPEVAIIEARKEILDYADHARQMFSLVEDLVLNLPDKNKKILRRLRKYEEESDRLEVEIARYLSKISSQNLSQRTSRQIKAMWSIINDLERIADQCEQLGRLMEKRTFLKIEFNQDAEEEIRSMFSAVNQAFQLMNENICESPGILVNMEEVFQIENDINALRNKLRDSHFIRLETGKCSMQSGLIYLDLIASLEKVADQIVSVQEAAANLKG